MQYCFERENTLPPFTCLEANGEPRLEYTEQGELIIFPLKVQPRLKYHSLRIEGVTMLMTDRIGPMISFSLSIWISRRTKL